MIIQPTVSICCITYNHENFIGQAIESFLMQKTSFPIEILIHDDASTDKTADIIREYELKYPDIIKPIYQTENQYSKGVSISATYQYPRALGKYIALCEGDDYWTDSLKLQKQVDFLEGNEEYGLIHTNNYVLYNGSGKIILNKTKTKYDVKDGYVFEKILTGDLSITTCTVLAKSSILLNLPDLDLINNPNNLQGDLPRWLSLSNQSKVKYLGEPTAVYRHNRGSASMSTSILGKIKFQESSKRLRKEFAERYNVNIKVYERVCAMYHRVILEKAFLNKDIELYEETIKKIIDIKLKDYIKYYYIKNNFFYLLMKLPLYIVNVIRNMKTNLLNENI